MEVETEHKNWRPLSKLTDSGMKTMFPESLFLKVVCGQTRVRAG